MDLTRILFLSDTHLGFDHPRAPRVRRRRRGSDFFANFERALSPALKGEVDAVVHGGDVFFRSRVAPEVVLRALRPLKAVADLGIPVYVVPGNHDRSRTPLPLLWQHPGIFVFDRPRTFVHHRRGRTFSISGFPYEHSVRAAFPGLVEATGWKHAAADARFLVMHHAVEGATVGPRDFTFGSQPDVVRTADIPSGFAAILSGHIHRAQALTRDGSGRALPAPVLYPGSTERTSFAEKDERKGTLTLAVQPNGRLRGWRFRELPSRPMRRIELSASDLPKRRLTAILSQLPADAVVQLKVAAPVPASLAITAVRAMAPTTMDVSVSPLHSFR